MSKERVFKVKYGFDKTQFVQVKEGADLERVIYAWTEQIPITLGDRMIHGKHIINIEPHYHHYTGWNEWYQPKEAEDWLQIKRDCPDFTGAIEGAKSFVQKCLQDKRQDLIGSGESVNLLVQEPKSTVNISKGLADKLKVIHIGEKEKAC